MIVMFKMDFFGDEIYGGLFRKEIKESEDEGNTINKFNILYVCFFLFVYNNVDYAVV